MSNVLILVELIPMLDGVHAIGGTKVKKTLLAFDHYFPTQWLNRQYACMA